MHQNEFDIETVTDGDFDENNEEVLEEHLVIPEIDSDSGSGAYGENDCHLRHKGWVSDCV